MRHLVTVSLLVVAWAAAMPLVAADAAAVSGGPATFEGEPIDLTEGWGEATACLIHPDGVECFRTRQELAVRERQVVTKGTALSDTTLTEDASVLATCSSALRLYDGTYQTGDTVSILTRSTWINLSSVGFDNRTSSFRVGACAVTLASGTWGGGSLYPRCTYAGCEEDVMATGWNNVISSVYLK